MTNRISSAAGVFEPELTRVHLPACPSCSGVHPLARKGYRGPPDVCPDCGGTAAEPGPAHSEKAALGFTPSGLAASALLGIGAALHKLSKRI